MGVSEGREALRAAKEPGADGGPALTLPVGRPTIGRLRPVGTRRGALSATDVRLVTEWRNRFADSFLTQFDATDERTERWLVDSVGPDDTRILFMLDDAEGRTVGHMGLAFIDWEAGTAEADSVVRGREGPRGLVTRALDAMWSWGREALGLARLRVRVRSDNDALRFYERAGFRELHRVPLRRHEDGDGVRWAEDPSAGDPGLMLVPLELGADG